MNLNTRKNPKKNSYNLLKMCYHEIDQLKMHEIFLLKFQYFGFCDSN